MKQAKKKPNSSDLYSRCIPQILHRRTQICTLLKLLNDVMCSFVQYIMLPFVMKYSCECPHTLTQEEEEKTKFIFFFFGSQSILLRISQTERAVDFSDTSPCTKRNIRFSCHIDIFRVFKRLNYLAKCNDI